jgi:hypothetical protein
MRRSEFFVVGETADLRIEVRNSGTAAEEGALTAMLDPLTRGTDDQREIHVRYPRDRDTGLPA